MSTEADNRSPSELNTHPMVAQRLLGVYPQKQSGLFMQRVKIFGGRINWRQWHKITQLATMYCQGFPLHLTTRQDIELHNIALEDIPAIHQGLAEVALTTFSAGGDSVRNITLCTGCDLHSDSYDLLPLAQLVWRHLEQQSVILNLPRKFKISFSGCQKACARPWLNDLGFIAQGDGLFTVIGAGSLGPKPDLGIQLYKDLPAKDVLPICVAAIEFFEQYGDRENRRRARLRHVRQQLADQAFRVELDDWFNRVKARQAWPDIVPAPSSKSIKLLCRFQLPNGNITPEDAVELADIAEPKAAVLRINLEHGLELYGTKAVQLPDGLAGFTSNPIIIACPGLVTCPRGLANCWATADRIREAINNRCGSEVRINISGCPNNCAQSAVADIGLVALLRKGKGELTECYRLFTGGGNGRINRLAEQSDIVRARDIPRVIEYLLKSVKPSGV